MGQRWQWTCVSTVAASPDGTKAVKAAMNISSYSIRNPIPSIVFFMLLTFAGLTAFQDERCAGFTGHQICRW